MLALAALSGCYSFAVVRYRLDVEGPGDTLPLHVWVSDQGMPESLPDGIAGAAAVVLLHPFNVLFGVMYTVQAPFDGRYDIRYGPLGGVAGLLPGLTVLPPLLRLTERTATPSASEYEELKAMVAEGQVLEAVLRLGEQLPWSPEHVLDAASRDE